MLKSRNPVRNLARYWQVQTTFVRYGLGFLVDTEQLRRFRPFLARKLSREADDMSGLSLPQRVRLLLQELGPTYVKLGQVVSSQSYVLPEEWLVELRKLQNEVAAVAYEEVRAVVIDELGGPPEALYRSFEQQPLAAASIGQVHRAVMHDGTEVVVKVQRPNIRPKIEEDLAIMYEIARFLTNNTAWARNYDVLGVVERFGEGLSEELDYTVEGRYADRLRDVLRDDPGVRTPLIYWDLVTSRVMTMEFIRGVKISDVAALDAAGIDRAALADRFIKAMIRQILIEGFFHADPHPGNVFVEPASGEIVFLDTGMMDSLSGEQREELSTLMVSLNQRDAAGVVRIATRLGQTFKHVDERRLTRIVERMIDRYLSSSFAEISFGEVIAQLLKALFDNGIRLSSELTLAVKAIVQMEQISRTLDAKISIATVAQSAAGELIQQRLSVEATIANLNRLAVEVLRLGPEARDAAAAIFAQLKTGTPTIRVEQIELQRQLAQLDRSANRTTVGVTVGGFTIGAAIALHAAMQDERTSVRLAGLGGFLLATAASGSVVGRALWEDLRRR